MAGLIGARIPRIEDGALLVGKGRFVDDIALAGEIAGEHPLLAEPFRASSHDKSAVH